MCRTDALIYPHEGQTKLTNVQKRSKMGFLTRRRRCFELWGVLIIDSPVHRVDFKDPDILGALGRGGT